MAADPFEERDPTWRPWHPVFSRKRREVQKSFFFHLYACVRIKHTYHKLWLTTCCWFLFFSANCFVIKHSECYFFPVLCVCVYSLVCRYIPLLFLHIFQAFLWVISTCGLFCFRWVSANVFIFTLCLGCYLQLTTFLYYICFPLFLRWFVLLSFVFHVNFLSFCLNAVACKWFSSSIILPIYTLFSVGYDLKHKNGHFFGRWDENIQ